MAMQHLSCNYSKNLKCNRTQAIDLFSSQSADTIQLFCSGLFAVGSSCSKPMTDQVGIMPTVAHGPLRTHCNHWETRACLSVYCVLLCFCGTAVVKLCRRGEMERNFLSFIAVLLHISFYHAIMPTAAHGSLRTHFNHWETRACLSVYCFLLCFCGTAVVKLCLRGEMQRNFPSLIAVLLRISFYHACTIPPPQCRRSYAALKR